jgi:hypothetical protein
MALLRNREVQILRVATEVDGSTFVVRYPDGETEMAKMNELIFTPQEFEAFVRTDLPEVRVMDQKDMTERRDRTKPEETEEDRKRKQAEEEALKNRPEAIEPDVVAANAYSPKNNNQAPKTQPIQGKSVDTSKPQTLPGLSRNQTPVNSHTPTTAVNKKA